MVSQVTGGDQGIGINERSQQQIVGTSGGKSQWIAPSDQSQWPPVSGVASQPTTPTKPQPLPPPPPLPLPRPLLALPQQTEIQGGGQSSDAGPPSPFAGPWKGKTKFSITANPRFGPLGKASVGGSTTTSQANNNKPAYVSVNKEENTTATDVAADATLMPKKFPPSVRSYVERVLARFREETQKVAAQNILKDMITKASVDGTLLSRDWDIEPLFTLPDVSGANTQPMREDRNGGGAELQNASPTVRRRTKSRWEPLPEETVQPKSMETFQNGAMSPSVREKQRWKVQQTKQELQRSNTAVEAAQFAGLSPGQRKRKGRKLRVMHLEAQASQLGANNGLPTGSESEAGESEKDDLESVKVGSFKRGKAGLSKIGKAAPEENQKRQKRAQRFEGLIDTGKPKGRVWTRNSATTVTRKVEAQNWSSSDGGLGQQSVEDLDWDMFTVRGTCQNVEKKYLRLTSAPDPASVRPEDVLQKSLKMVKSTTRGYLYRCEQLKSIRQDLTVQRIRNGFTAEVYEMHARMALESGDIAEFNQCQSQVKVLYAEGIPGCFNEFAAYSLLHAIVQNGPRFDLQHSMAQLSRDAKRDSAVQHALGVRAAVATNNYCTFFRLYHSAPNLNRLLMDLMVEKIRFQAVQCMAKTYKPSVSVSYIARILAFGVAVESVPGGKRDKLEVKTLPSEADGVSKIKETRALVENDIYPEVLEECEEWLRAHGCVFLEKDGERLIDCMASKRRLFMPEPEDVVPHGDANLELTDFLSRTNEVQHGEALLKKP